MAPRKKSQQPEYLTKPTVDSEQKTKYLVLWWHLQKLFMGLFENEIEASLHAGARNGVKIEILYSDHVSIGSVDDYWRRDEEGRPMPGEWRTARILVED